MLVQRSIALPEEKEKLIDPELFVSSFFVNTIDNANNNKLVYLVYLQNQLNLRNISLQDKT